MSATIWRLLGDFIYFRFRGGAPPHFEILALMSPPILGRQHRNASDRAEYNIERRWRGQHGGMLRALAFCQRAGPSADLEKQPFNIIVWL